MDITHCCTSFLCHHALAHSTVLFFRPSKAPSTPALVNYTFFGAVGDKTEDWLVDVRACAGVVLVVFLGDVAGIVPSGFLAYDMYVSMHVSAAERSGIMYPATRGDQAAPPRGIHFTRGHRVVGCAMQLNTWCQV